MHAAHRSPAEFLAARVRQAAPSPTLAVSEKARQLKAQGRDVIDLGGGDPDFITPEHIRIAAANAMNAGDTHYVASNGTPALRNALARKLQDDNGLTYDPSEIIVTTGGKQALFEASMALGRAGRRRPDPRACLGLVRPHGDARRRQRHPRWPGSGYELDSHPRRSRGARDAGQPDPLHEFAVQSHRAGPDQRGTSNHRGFRDRPRSDRLHGRDVREDHLRRSDALFAGNLAGSLGSHHYLQRLFQSLCDDRLAPRVHGRTEGLHDRDRQGPEPLDHPRHLLRDGRRCRRAQRAAGVDRRDGSRVGSAQKARYRRSEHDQRHRCTRRPRAPSTPSPISAEPA